MRHNVDGIFSGFALSTMIPVDDFGREFIAPNIGWPTPAGYTLRVIASDNDTNVNHEGSDYTLSEGETMTFDHRYLDDIVSVLCSKLCNVIHFPYGLEHEMGTFMMNTLSFEGYYISCYHPNLPPMLIDSMDCILEAMVIWFMLNLVRV